MIKEVHIFKAGTQTSAQGITREFTKKDLEEIASSYDSGVHEAPIRIGHEDNDKVPAWGWVKGVKVKGDELFAEVDFSPLAEDYVKNGLYKKVSASFYSPESKINPEPGKWSLRHVALLGAQPPAVKGLKGFAYEESGDGIVDFATTLSPDAVFDPELGPTLKRDLGPLEILKEKLDEARAEMNTQEQAMEQQLEAPAEIKEETAAGEFAEGEMMGMKKPKKKMNSEKMGTEGESSDEDEDEDEDTMMAAEMEGKDLPAPLKKNAAKKHAEKTGKSMDEAMSEDEDDDEDEDFASCGSKKDKKMMYAEDEEDEEDEEEFKARGKKKGMMRLAEDSDDEQHGEGKVTMPRSDKMGKPSPKGMSGLPEECPEGEGPVASKVKKDAKSGHGMEDEDKFEEDGEPTFEPSKKKRGSDGRKSSDTGMDETAPFEEDDEQHGEGEDTDKYTKRGQVGKPDSMAETGRKKTGKAKEIKGYPDGEGKNSESGKHSEIKGYPDGKGMNSEKGDDGGEQDEDRKKKGTGKEMAGYPDSYMSTGMGGGKGKQVKGGKVRVMTVNHSESDDPIAAMMARLEELEAANARLREQAEFAERQTNRMRLEQFAEGLYESGKLTDAVVSQEQLVDYMEGLEYGTLEFAEGESAATPLMKILESLPSQVCFEELAGGAVETHEEELDPHRQALKIKEEEGIEYSEALKRVLFPAE
jgi:hypothetical protein